MLYSNVVCQCMGRCGR